MHSVDSGRFVLSQFNNKKLNLDNGFGDNEGLKSQSNDPVFRICCIGKQNLFYRTVKF